MRRLTLPGARHGLEDMCLRVSRWADHRAVGRDPLAPRTLTALRLKVQLIRSGNLGRSISRGCGYEDGGANRFVLSAKLSARIDLYLEKFRDRIPGAARHNGLWPSNKGSLMDDGSIYDAVRRRTLKTLGFAVNLHSFPARGPDVLVDSRPKKTSLVARTCSGTARSARLRNSIS